ncbi:putative motility protein [Ideonella sp. DXS29W]|uniref:Motility protein n=1 Tax=Ideonella lacteola TaxID=2984193 RepID=A0ABU9BXL6_9BURK
MNISNSPSVNAATAAASQGPTGDAVQILVLRKALNTQAAGALALLEALPTQPPLATEGSVGRHVNTYA